VTAHPKAVGDWLVLRSLRSKMCLSPSPNAFGWALIGDPRRDGHYHCNAFAADVATRRQAKMCASNDVGLSKTARTESPLFEP